MELTDKTRADFITIETHFGVPGHFIRANTRNKCSEDMVSILQEIAQILYPNDDFEVFLLPPEPGSYKDIIKFVKKHKVGVGISATIGTTVTIGGLAVAFLNYKDSHTEHIHNTEMNIVDDVTKCLELKKTMEELREGYTMDNIPEEKINLVCKNINLQKKKNSVFDTLKGDTMIENNETILKNSEEKILLTEKIERKDFQKYIEPMLDRKYELQSVSGIIELISPVVKQKKEGRGITWRGTYYGDDIIHEGTPILSNGEDMDFFMQDQDLKSQINNKERVFAQGDNMKAIFDINGEIKGVSFLNRSIYIKEVQSYNEDIIPHKEKLARQNSDVSDDHPKLFGEIEDK
jgi:hypothetical protein